jgi:hypothetical protein
MMLVGKLEGKRPLRGPIYGCMHNIKMDFGERGWSGMDWIVPARDWDKWSAPMKVVMTLQVP